MRREGIVSEGVKIERLEWSVRMSGGNREREKGVKEKRIRKKKREQ